MRSSLLAALTVTLWASAAAADEAPTPPRLIAPVELSLPPGAEVPEGGVELLLTVELDGRAGEPELLTELVDPAVREAVLTPNEQLQTTLGVEDDLWINELRGQAPSFAELPNVPAPAETRAAIAVDDRLQELNLAPYVEQVLRPEPFELALGVRAEYYRYADVSTWQLEPRGVVRLKVSELLTLKAASGLFSQAPLPYEQNRSYGNPDLKPNRALQSSVGSEFRFEEAWSADATVFYDKMWQLTRVSGRPALHENAASGDDGALAFSPSSATTARAAPTAWSCCCGARSSRELSKNRLFALAPGCLTRGILLYFAGSGRGRKPLRGDFATALQACSAGCRTR